MYEVSKGSAKNAFHETLIFAVRSTEHLSSTCDLLTYRLHVCIHAHASVPVCVATLMSTWSLVHAAVTIN